MTEISKEKLNKFSLALSCGIFVFSILLFWLGLNLLKSEIFPHYYNPSKHVIVKQNPDTKEIYAWKDAEGKVYTQEDAQVKNFTWGITALLLIIMIFGTTVYNLIIKYYTKILIEKEPEPRRNYVARLQ
ncbi:hypothetical protein IT084_08235 [Desulfallas sp. Bu1-1]|jgi:amino acid transporter|uniref:hypothetical protein n=1 Tax=Desulfallas sp. Bu1-1 TaxID=2787620 RepID=UPI00189F0624|nr:hypothetical protein [Desulfallas sp. Bu1-1]MBF7082962.1 hypothetical protein [Desulfallas sp. Bu1-1]